MSPTQRRRLSLVTYLALGSAVVVILVLIGLNHRIDLFRTPSDLIEAPLEGSFRLGGMVKKGSLVRMDGLKLQFVVTDFENDLLVFYEGILPDLFREGQGIVAKGQLKGSHFIAQEVLAKHDETYMPPQLAKKLDNG